MIRALLILGPTASGKSALALALARELGGEIVNADSMQVYRDLRVLTARPSPEEEARVPHHLYGAIDAAVRYSTGAWARAAAPLIDAIIARGRTPIVVGGTGLYFMALTQGLAEIPAPAEDLVNALRARVTAEGPEVLHAELRALDPHVAAAITPRDGPRIVRALSVLQETGRSIADWRGQTRPMLAEGAWFGVALTPPREQLYSAIERRFEGMLDGGALEEAGALAARRLDPTLPALKAHGQPWLAAHLGGDLTLDAAAALSIRDTRRYAKRQTTWIAHQTPDWPRIEETGLQDRMAHVLTLLGRLDGAQEVN